MFGKTEKENYNNIMQRDGGRGRKSEREKEKKRERVRERE